MSTSDACKSARHDDGQFGTQPRAEVPDIDLPLQATAPAPTPATSYLPVDAETKERLSRTATSSVHTPRTTGTASATPRTPAPSYSPCRT